MGLWVAVALGMAFFWGLGMAIFFGLSLKLLIGATAFGMLMATWIVWRLAEPKEGFYRHRRT